MNEPKTHIEYLETTNGMRTIVSTEFPIIPLNENMTLHQITSIARSLNRFNLSEEYQADLGFKKDGSCPFIKITLRDE